MDLGEKIRHYRRLKNLTQKQLGDIIGISASNITKYEKGNIEPTVSILEKIAAALDININELFTAKQIEENTLNMFKNIYIEQLNQSPIVTLLNEVNTTECNGKYNVEAMLNDINFVNDAEKVFKITARVLLEKY